MNSLYDMNIYYNRLCYYYLYYSCPSVMSQVWRCHSRMLVLITRIDRGRCARIAVNVQDKYDVIGKTNVIIYYDYLPLSLCLFLPLVSLSLPPEILFFLPYFLSLHPSLPPTLPRILPSLSRHSLIPQ